MRRLAVLPPTLLLLLAVTACAAPAGQGGGTPAGAGSPAGSSGASTGCRSGQATLTERDNGAEVCVTAGTRVEVYLHGEPARKWAAVSSSGPALRPTASGKGTLPVGVTGGFFVADGTGTARLTSSRPACSSPPPGGARCLALQTFTVTVQVR